jgi:hypothetical protein
MPDLTIAAMTAEIREVNTAKGWQLIGGGPGSNTLGDRIALIESEIAEALEAYRDHRLADATAQTWAGTAIPDAKPEGVGSEFADVLIRMLSTADVFGYEAADPDCIIDDIDDLDPMADPYQQHELVSFGDHMAWLTRRVDRIWTSVEHAPWALRALVTVARRYGIDLDSEYTRKIAYNRTRPYRHGGRTLSDA